MKKVTLLAMAALLCFGAAAQADIDNLDFGGDLMVEYFFSDNVDRNDNNEDQTDFFRMEAHIWMQADLDDNIMARISLETDRAFNSIGVNQNTNNLANQGSDDLDVYLEEAFLKIQGVWGSNFNFSAGRQFLNYGDNPYADNYNGWWGPSFIFGDARTNDPLVISQLGSYEIDPFDAIVAQWEGEMFQVDLAYAIDAEETIGLSPGSDNDASTLLLYGSYFGIEGHQLDLYFNMTEQDNPGAFGTLGFDGEHYIVGGRAAGDLNEAFAYKAEVAYQFQDMTLAGAQEFEGFAAQAGVNYHPDMNYNPNVGFMFTYLDEDQNGLGFVSPYEGKTFGQLAEGVVKLASLQNSGLAAFTNMMVFNLNGGMEFSENVAGSLDLYYFLMPEEVVNVGTGQRDDDGGFEFDGQIDYRFNDNLTSFLGGGVLFPGGALEDATGEDDEAFFVRTGMKVQF